MDASPPRGVFTHTGSVDLVRDEAGQFLVLKDNLQAPSGVSCMIENRMAERRVLPELFSRYRVRRVEHYPAMLSRSLRHYSPRGEDRATIVMLMPGDRDAGYLEHAYLAREMGVELATGQDLICRDDRLYLKTRWGLRQVDVVYRRVDDELLDPLVFHRESVHGVAGIIDAWRAGNVAIVNAPGAGIADDKAVHAHVPAIIRYYLGDAPVLPNVPTFEMTDFQDRDYVLDNLERMVVKAAGESGRGGVLMGPCATPAQRSDLVRRIRDNPRNYVAQPVVHPSRHVCYRDGELESRHLDLRSFFIYGHDVGVLPGGLTRVDMNGGAQPTDGSRRNGSKDTWVLDD
jgi:uncharacterized circularly permuted ATP-grasp superfamily protein